MTVDGDVFAETVMEEYEDATRIDPNDLDSPVKLQFFEQMNAESLSAYKALIQEYYGDEMTPKEMNDTFDSEIGEHFMLRVIQQQAEQGGSTTSTGNGAVGGLPVDEIAADLAGGLSGLPVDQSVDPADPRYQNLAKVAQAIAEEEANKPTRESARTRKLAQARKNEFGIEGPTFGEAFDDVFNTPNVPRQKRRGPNRK